MSNEKRLFLHIGTHKTGTTSFQASLRSNSRKLVKQGFRPIRQSMPGPDGKERIKYNVSQVPNSILRPGAATVARLLRRMRKENQAANDAKRAEILAEMNGFSEPNLIMSSEAFTFLRTPEEAAKMREFLAATGRNVTTLLVLRNEADWRASWHNQIRKKPQAWELNRTLPEDRRADGEWYFDRQAIIDFWSQFSEVRTIDYDAALAADKSILPALYREIGVETKKLDLDFNRNTRVELPEG